MFRRFRGVGEGDNADLRHLPRLFRLVRPYRAPLAVALLATAIGGGLQLALPLLSRDLFNRAFEGGQVAGAGLDRIALLLLGAFVLQAGFNFLRVYLLGIVGEGLVADLRKTVFTHLLTLPVRFFENRKSGEITSRLTSDVGTVRNLASNALAQFVNQFVTLVGGVVALFFINTQLTLVMLAVIPVVIVGGAVFGRRLRRLSQAFQDRVADANADAEEAISNVRVVKSFTGEPLERDRYGRGVDASYVLARRRALVRALFVPSVILAMFSGITLVLWVGGRQVLAGALAPGDLIAFLFLTLFIAGSVAMFTGLYSQLQEGLGASRRLFDLLDTESDLPEPTAPRPLGTVRGAMAALDVSFRYGGRGEDWVLRNVSLRADPGEVVALVGPSGAGKSTLVSLLPRFFDPVEGRITLDGRDLRDIALADLRSAIAMVPQETQLFSGSVLENVRYGRPDADDAAVREAAEAAHADAFVQAFPDGYDTVVGERGVKLSGGQRQRIAIARALLKDPRVLVLDEATSSLDSESEALVQAALDRLMRGRTTFVIAHRLATVLNADRIVVLDDGLMVQQGTHDQLLAEGGLYAALHERQFRTAVAP